MSEEINNAIDASAGLAVKELKKVIASRGKLQGNFYFACDGKAKVAALAVTLTARDKKGMKVVSQGKKLRKALKATKFARGTVINAGSKVKFEVHTGSAAPSLVKKAFKKAFEDETGDNVKTLKRYLRKAMVGAPDQTAEAVSEVGDEVDDSALSKDDVELSRDDEALTLEERVELDELIRAQGSLSQQNAALGESFLSAESAEEDRQERINVLARQASRLLKDPDGSADKLAEVWAKMAEERFTGEDPFSEDSESISSESQQLLESVRSGLKRQTALSSAFLAYTTALKTASTQLDALKTALKKTGDGDLVAIADRGLSAMMSAGLDELKKSLAAAERASSDEQDAKLKLVLPTIASSIATINNHPAFVAVDENPFSVKVSIRQTLTPTLLQLQNACAV